MCRLADPDSAIQKAREILTASGMQMEPQIPVQDLVRAEQAIVDVSRLQDQSPQALGP